LPLWCKRKEIPVDRPLIAFVGTVIWGNNGAKRRTARTSGGRHRRCGTQLGPPSYLNPRSQNRDLGHPRPAGIRTKPRMVRPQRDASTTPTAAIMLSPTIAIPKTLLEMLSAGEQSLSK